MSNGFNADRIKHVKTKYYCRVTESSPEELSAYCRESERCLLLLLMFSVCDSALQLALRVKRKKET